MIKITEEFYHIFIKIISVCFLITFLISRFITRKEHSYTSYLRKETLILYQSLFFSIIGTDFEIREYGSNTFPITSPLFSLYQTLNLLEFLFIFLCGAFVKIPIIPRYTKSDKSIIDSIHRIIYFEDLRLTFKEKPWEKITIAEQNAFKEQDPVVLVLLTFFIIVIMALHYGKILGAHKNPYLKPLFELIYVS